MNITTLEMSRGDSRRWNFAATQNGAVYSLAGASLWFTAKKRITELDAVAVFQKTLGTGITVTDAANGLGYIELSPSDTSGLSAAKWNLEFDLQCRDSAGKIYTLAFGKLTVYPDVTITTS